MLVFMALFQCKNTVIIRMLDANSNFQHDPFMSFRFIKLNDKERTGKDTSIRSEQHHHDWRISAGNGDRMPSSKK